MLETVKRWNRKWTEFGEAASERDWKTWKSLFGEEHGKRIFEGYLYLVAVVSIFEGVVLGLLFGQRDLNAFLANHWVLLSVSIVAMLIIGFGIEHESHALRDFYRRRKELFGRHFT